MYAADDVLVEHLRNGGFFGRSRNPWIAAEDFVQIPRIFGLGIIFGQLRRLTDFQTTFMGQGNGIYTIVQ